LLGQTLDHLLGEENVEALRCGLENVVQEGPYQHVMRLRQFPGRSASTAQAFELFAHRRHKQLIIELECVAEEDGVALSSLYGEVRRCMARFQATRSVREFLETAAQQLRQLTGFDRVHVYQFLDDRSGLVRAESNSDGLTPYIGLRFPASDVPEPARQLLSQMWIRYLPDAAYQAIPLLPELNPLTAEALDLGHALLRSTSPMCNRFYLNMGVRSTLTLTLLKNGKLWGFIACHHSTPKVVAHEIREACESLAHMVSLLMTAKEDAEEKGDVIAVKANVERLIEAMTREDLYHLGLIRSEQVLLDCVEARGAAIVVGEGMTLLGHTPNEAQIDGLAKWLASRDELFATDCLPQQYPKADAFRELASGLLAIRLPEGSGYLLWFRPQQVQEVRWAGNPVKPVEIDLDSGLAALGPRRSFEVWKETVYGCSVAWKPYHIEAAAQLGQAMRALHRAERLTQANKVLVQGNEELESFAYTAAHELKEPLRNIGRYSGGLVQNLGGFSLEDEKNRLDAILRLTRRMDGLIDALLNYSRLGNTQLALQYTDLGQVVMEALDSLRSRLDEANVEITVKPGLPVLICDPIRIHQVFVNLICNAMKYNQSDCKRIEIGSLDGEKPVFYVKDNGIGIDSEFHESIFGIFRRLHGRDAYGGGTGAGLSIVKKVIQLHGGRIWVESAHGKGSVFYFSLPGSEQLSNGNG